MSLFKAREWWATTSGFEEFHDLGCLSVGNIDNDPSGFGKRADAMHTHTNTMTNIHIKLTDKIVVGSFQGLIRIYSPHPPTCVPSHVILEKQLSMPVIQVALGHFVKYVQYIIIVKQMHLSHDTHMISHARVIYIV